MENLSLADKNVISNSHTHVTYLMFSSFFFHSSLPYYTPVHFPDMLTTRKSSNSSVTYLHDRTCLIPHPQRAQQRPPINTQGASVNLTMRVSIQAFMIILLHIITYLFLLFLSFVCFYVLLQWIGAFCDSFILFQIFGWFCFSVYTTFVVIFVTCSMGPV